MHCDFMICLYRDVVFEGDGSPRGHANMKSTQGLLAMNDLCVCVLNRLAHGFAKHLWHAGK